ncbi:MAG: PAS domain-containing sensor histidine kinase [Gemmatimonadetes bacterium]|nr:PAS domain-containing sensor histidine kinase [Gemmatimonadota bacterium]
MSSRLRRRFRLRLSYERRVVLLGILIGLPGSAIALALLWTGGYSSKVRWTLAALIVAAWWALGVALRERAVRPLQTLSNLVTALLQGDTSFRSRVPETDDALGLALRELDRLAETLREQRLGALEATALLRKVIAEIDVAVFAFDDQRKLRLVNRAGARLLARAAERVLGERAEDLGLADCLDAGDGPRIVDLAFPGGGGRWEVRTSEFRQGGLPHQLLVLSDLSRALREEERKAWQRLVRVLGHEINNSLAPIKSIAASLQDLLAREPRTGELGEDVRRGLGVIAARAEALGRFMGAYSRLARLPPPRPESLDVAAWVHGVAALEPRLSVRVEPGPDLTVWADRDQLDQLLINLVHNAVDAAFETGGEVSVRWTRRAGHLQVIVEDEGPGIADTANLFVPFFTTKPQGSGIGLVLSRQIAEAHGGALSLENRRDRPGCRARLTLPLASDKRA